MSADKERKQQNMISYKIYGDNVRQQEKFITDLEVTMKTGKDISGKTET